MSAMSTPTLSAKAAVAFKGQGRTTTAFLLLNLPSFPLATGNECVRERERERKKTIKNYLKSYVYNIINGYKFIYKYKF
jgi:hypothetical protein